MTGPDLAVSLASALERLLPDLVERVSLDPGRFAEIPRETMTAEEVGNLKCLRLSCGRIRDLAREGRFPGAYKQGRDWMFPHESVRLYLRAKQRETAEAYGFGAGLEDATGPQGAANPREDTMDPSHGKLREPEDERKLELEDEWDPDEDLDWHAWEEEFDE